MPSHDFHGKEDRDKGLPVPCILQILQADWTTFIKNEGPGDILRHQCMVPLMHGFRAGRIQARRWINLGINSYPINQCFGWREIQHMCSL